jgi:hypothetical protein
MKCSECGGNFIRKHGNIELQDNCIGNFVVRDIEYLRCDKCEEYLFSCEASQNIEKSRNQKLQSIIQSQPLDEFISSSETAQILGITRQALHKHRRIRRGFIYQTQFGDKIVYLKKSVLLFKSTGDGRYPLREQENNIQYTNKTLVIGSSVLFNPPYIDSQLSRENIFTSMKKTGSQGVYYA